MNSRHVAQWIWHPHFVDHDTVVPGRFVSFRKTISLDTVPEKACIVNVSADTRYRLYVNGQSVAFGPCKSYPTRWFYETVDIRLFLAVGINVISAKVLRFFPDQIGSSSLMTANIPGFILWGSVGSLNIISDETWQCYQDASISLRSRAEWNYILGPPFLSLDERVDSNKQQDDWSNAVLACPPVKMMPVLEPWKLHKRPIPHLPEISARFSNVTKATGSCEISDWRSCISGESSITIPVNSTAMVHLESKVLTTAFLEFGFSGGFGTEIDILYSEGYEKDLKTDRAPFPLPRNKGNRSDFENGRLYGTEDHVVLAAPEGQQTYYEPFWFRTFRYVQLKIITKPTPLIISKIAFRETHYPLEITTGLDLQPKNQQIWDICLNTLRNCMHETYEDCPFYEQNQFAMDGRLQLLFTYQLSRDDRLARKTVHEFHASRREDGLVETNFPVSFRAINIPQFSLYWIHMISDHFQYFGDKSLIREYMPTADGILNYFDKLLNPDGLIGKFDPECWAFIDWVQAWQGRNGIRDMAVPPIYKTSGVAAYNSLVYAWTLNTAATLADYINRHDTAGEYRLRAESLNAAVRKHCYSASLGFFTDGPGTNDLSEHTQIFAILSGAVSGPEAAALLKRTLDADVGAMPRCSFAMKFYVFRALEIVGLYDEFFDRMMEPWERMVANNLTTCPEDEVSFRSDCHGWSAGPIYEFVACVYGIRPRGPGFASKVEGEDGVIVSPRRKLMPKGEMRYQLPGGGMLSVDWEEGGDVRTRLL